MFVYRVPSVSLCVTCIHKHVRKNLFESLDMLCWMEKKKMLQGSYFSICNPFFFDFFYTKFFSFSCVSHTLLSVHIEIAHFPGFCCLMIFSNCRIHPFHLERSLHVFLFLFLYIYMCADVRYSMYYRRGRKNAQEGKEGLLSCFRNL